ncbi:hypothetical protein KM043_006717 [Ampulex compressa]|nr:hypothetical protein KM043_006717 [Ampulex compressa]
MKNQDLEKQEKSGTASASTASFNYYPELDTEEKRKKAFPEVNCKFQVSPEFHAVEGCPPGLQFPKVSLISRKSNKKPRSSCSGFWEKHG